MTPQGALALLSMLSLCGAQKWKLETTALSHSKTCSNLTQVLDNWKFAIMTQVKDMLVNDHGSVLPEYNRIQPLSVALGDLYRQFDSLKDDLRRLTSKFDGVESFVDDLQSGKVHPHPVWTASRRPIQRFPSRALRPALQAQMREPERMKGLQPVATRMAGSRVRPRKS